MYGFLADLMVAIHLAYVAYVVLGQVVIIVAAPFRWQWARNPWFRWSHLLCIAIVAYEAIMKLRCPLTIWEDQLRIRAGQGINNTETFMGRLVRDVLFIEGMPPVFFTTIYIAMFVVVLQGLLMYPPRRFRRRPRLDAAG